MMKNSKNTQITKQTNLFYILMIILMVFISFHKVLYADFLIIDDDINTYKNAYFQNISLNSFLRFWQSPYENLYIPITYNFWAIWGIVSKAIFGRLSPIIFHFANVLMHSLNSIIVFYLLQIIISSRNSDILDNRKISFWAAILFAVHPVMVESVAWISGMKDLLFSFFSLLSIIIYLKNTLNKQASTQKTLLAFLFFIMALFSKPTAVIIPFFIAVIVFFLLKKPIKSITPLYLWAVFSLIIAIFSKINMPPPPAEHYVPVAQRLFIATYSVFFYIKKIIWPDVLIYDYGETPELIMTYVKISFLPIIMTVILVIFIHLKNKVFLGLTLLFLLSIMPYSGLVPFEFQRFSTVADRYSYFCLLPVSMGIGLMLANFHKLKNILPVVLLIISLLVARTISQTSVWQNDISLADNTIRYNSKSYGSYINLGIKKASNGLFNDAIYDYQKALEISPDNILADYNLGIAYACIKKYDLALHQQNKLKKNSPYYSKKLEQAIETIKSRI